jgi:hypothetical protein
LMLLLLLLLLHIDQPPSVCFRSTNFTQESRTTIRKKSSFLSIVLAISTDIFLSESEAQLRHKFPIVRQELRRCRSHSLWRRSCHHFMIQDLDLNF